MPSHPGSSSSALVQSQQYLSSTRPYDGANGNGHAADGQDTDVEDDYAHRPSSAPGNKPVPRVAITASVDDTAQDQPKRRPKPPLLRSKSEHYSRQEEPEQADEEVHNWSARHGFEDHYQSEDIISDLANVRAPLPRRLALLAGHTRQTCSTPPRPSLLPCSTMPPRFSACPTEYALHTREPTGGSPCGPRGQPIAAYFHRASACMLQPADACALELVHVLYR